MKRFFKLFAALGTAVALIAPQAAQAQSWPSRPIAFVVPFTPGGITDNNSRLLAKLLGDRLGQPVVVENKPGAGGSIGVEAGSRQAPDGYTMIYGTQGTHAANLALYKNLRYDPVNDFVAVHGMTETPLILVINPSRPFKTVPELVAYAKAHPGKLNFGSAGPGTGTHLTAELFQSAAGIKMTHVPYKGSSPALTDLMAGNLDVMFDYATVVMPFVKTQKLTALAVTSKARLAGTPDLPTVGELGYPGAESNSWSAVFLPAKTPPEIAKRLGDAVAQVMGEPEMRQANERYGSTVLNLRDDKLKAFVKSEGARWRAVIQQAGVTLD